MQGVGEMGVVCVWGGAGGGGGESMCACKSKREERELGVGHMGGGEYVCM